MVNSVYDGKARKVGLHVTIFRPRRSNNWYLRWREPVKHGRRASSGRNPRMRVVERSTGQSTFPLAVKVATQKDDELERARLNGSAESEKPRRILIDHALRVHLNDLESVGRGFEHCKKTRQRLKHFVSHLRDSGIRFLDEVNTLVVQEYVNILTKRLVPRSIKNYGTTITGWLNTCVTYGWMQENPAGIGKGGKLRLPFEPDVPMGRGEELAKRVPTHAEYLDLVAACDGWTADAVRLIANTGIRYGELMFLTIEDFDPDKGTLAVAKKELPYRMPKTIRQLLKDKTRNLWWPKAGGNRMIPLTKVSREVLQRRKDIAEALDIPWLFANRANNPRAHNKALDLLKRAAVSAKVMMNGKGKSRLGWHTLRRYFVSVASTCMSLPSVLESAGHDSIGMWNLYRETIDEAVREDFKRFDEKTNGNDEEECGGGGE